MTKNKVSYHAKTREQALAFFAIVSALWPKTQVLGKFEDSPSDPLGSYYMKQYWGSYPYLELDKSSNYATGYANACNCRGLVATLDELVKDLAADPDTVVVALSYGVSAEVSKDRVVFSKIIKVLTENDMADLLAAKLKLSNQ